MGFKYVLIFCLVVTKLMAFSSQEKCLPFQVPTYFSYKEEELLPLLNLSSSASMHLEELEYWDKILGKLLTKFNVEEDTSRIYAYLYISQREVAYLTYQLSGYFQGSMHPISALILQLFFPDAQFPQLEQADAYSKHLAKIVSDKMRARFLEEQSMQKPYPVKVGTEYWQGSVPFYGQNVGSGKPWILSSSHLFRQPPPDYGDFIWEDQIEQVRRLSKDLNAQQKQAILFWADMAPGELFERPSWLKMAYTWMKHKQTPFPLMLLIRSTLATTLSETVIATFDAKYTYWVKRPTMLDATLSAAIEVPNHPSYPSAHSTTSMAAATILSVFFPQDQKMWQDLAQQAGLSRIWAGIHFPLDHEKGRKLGYQVARSVLKEMQIENKETLNTF